MPTILRVEDTLNLARAIQQALELFTSPSPDLTILDGTLPKMDGLEVLRWRSFSLR